MPPRRRSNQKPDQSAAAGGDGTGRNLRKIRPAPIPYSPGATGTSGWEPRSKTSDDGERRRKRRESDAKCRANLSSCFSSLRTQVQQRHEGKVKMSKEALLYSSIDQIQYLEAILVLLQQNQDISSGVAPSQPVEVLQGLHREFISEKEDSRPEFVSHQRNPGKSMRSSGSKETAIPTTKPLMVDVVSLNNELATREATLDATQRARKPRKRARRRKAHTTTVHESPVNSNPTGVQNKVTPDIVQRCAMMPTAQLRRGDSSTGAGRPCYVSTPSRAQQVPHTPGRWVDQVVCTEFGVHQVPGTPVKTADPSAGHYRISGNDVTPSKSDAIDLCNNCQIEGSTYDLTCYEDPKDWKEEFMHTPLQGIPDDMINFRTPTLKRKLPKTQSVSAERKSRKRLFTPDKKGKPLNHQTEKLPPVRTYAKRATAARTRPWDAVAWKVTSPYQPYSGLHRQRKESQGEKSRQTVSHRAKKTHRERQLKLMQAMGLAGRGAAGATIEHRDDTVSVSYRDTKLTFETPGREECRSNSQDSLSITEPPSLPQNIRNLISIEDALPCDSSLLQSDVPLEVANLGVANLGELLLDEDDYYSSLEMYPDSLGDLPVSRDDLPELSPQNLLMTDDDPGDNLHGNEITVQLLSPQQARVYYKGASARGQGGAAIRPEASHVAGGLGTGGGELNALIQPGPPKGGVPVFGLGTDGQGMEHGGCQGLEGLIQQNVWRGARNQDITLTQLQTEPIFGGLTSVYESPQWAMPPLGDDRSKRAGWVNGSKEADWLDVGSNEESPAGSGDSWDTTDFLSSIESEMHMENSSESQQSSSSRSSVELEPGCAASRAIEEYQVVPHYRPEE